LVSFDYHFQKRHLLADPCSIVGKPIAVPKLLEGEDEPTEEQLQEVQAQYIKSLKAIYDKYKDIYAKDRVKEMSIIA
jgi:2-acylglycerol O-acyltransferase 2